MVGIIVSALVFFVPFLRVLFLPLVYLATHLHEFSHAVVGTLTGGAVESINVYANGSGLTLIRGGNAFLFSSAGYLGATAIGIAMILAGRTPIRAKITLGVVGVMMACSMLLWVRGDFVGIISGLVWMLLLSGAFMLRGMTAVFICQIAGVQQCVNAMSGVLVLFHITMGATEFQSDALNMQNLTWIPAPVWATLWSVMSAVGIGLAIRGAWRPVPGQTANPGQSPTLPGG